MNNFALNLTQITNIESFSLLTDALSKTCKFDEQYIDLIHFINLISNSFENNRYSNLTTSIVNLKNYLNDVIIFNYCHDVFDNNANGISIYLPFPRTTIIQSYDSQNFDFIDDAYWKFFVNTFKQDNDSDGLADWFEYKYSKSLKNMDEDNDIDNDGLTNIWEYWYGSNPNIIDTDSDKLDDYTEIKRTNSYPYSNDSDLDGFTDWEEVVIYKSDPKEWQDTPCFRWYPFLVPITTSLILIPVYAIFFRRRELKKSKQLPTRNEMVIMVEKI